MDRVKEGATDLMTKTWSEILQKIVVAAEKEDNHNIQKIKCLVSSQSAELDTGKLTT